MSISIRALTSGDHAAVCALWARCEGLAPAPDATDLTRFLERNPGLSQAAWDGAALRGVIPVGFDGMRGHLSRLATDPDRRRQGIASRVVDAALSALRAAGARRCHLLVFGDNAAAMGFWAERGWDHYRHVEMWDRRLERDGASPGTS